MARHLLQRTGSGDGRWPVLRRVASDTGGSIRWPCGATGLTGLKPAWGRVSRFGVAELAASLDHVGPVARSAADAAAILGAVAGSNYKDPTTLLDPVPDYLPPTGGSTRTAPRDRRTVEQR